MRVVMKFGGTSVGDASAIRKAVAIIKESYEKGNEVAVVVSAMTKVTDQIIDAAEKIISGEAPELPHQPRPEAARPPAVSVKGRGDPVTLLALVGNDPRRSGGFQRMTVFHDRPVQCFSSRIAQCSTPPWGSRRELHRPGKRIRRTGARFHPRGSPDAAWESEYGDEAGWYWLRDG